MTLAQTFHNEAIANAQTAMLAHGAPTKRLLLTLQERGGVETAREQFKRHRVSDGFDHLASCGHLELSLEALMTKGKYASLFTDDEVNWCLDALLAAGYY